MGFLLVLVAALAAGAGVWAWTLRQGRVPVGRAHTWSGTYAEPDPAPAVPATSSALPPRRSLPTDPTWRSRLFGVVGLVVACVAAAALLVACGYALWSTVSRAFGG